MRRRLHSVLAAAAVFAASGALVLTAAGPAGAETNALLPISSYPSGFVVDGVHQRVFVSVPGENKIIATDYEGTALATFDDLPGVSGIALAADSGHLYAAVPGQSAIVSIATATLTRAASYPTGGGFTQPISVAVDGDHVWFGYTDFRGGDIGSVDLSGAQPVVTLDQDDATGWIEAPLVVAGPGHRLAAADRTSSSGTMAVYDATGGALRQTALGGDFSISFIRDLAFTPDGSHLVVPATDHHQLLKTSDLSRDGSYTTGFAANSLAVAPDGSFAGGVETGGGPDVYVFEPGATTPVRQINFPPTPGSENAGGSPVPGGLAWEPGGTRLFALVENLPGVYWSLRVIDEPGRQTPTVTVTAPATGTPGTALTVSGTVTGGDPIAAGTLLTVTRTDAQSPAGTSLDPVPLSAGGTFTFTDVPPVDGTVTYKVGFPGDAGHFPASGAASVTVSQAGPAVVSTTLSRQYKTAKIGSTSYAYFHKKTDPLTTTTMTPHPGRRQNLVVQTYARGSWQDTSSEFYPLAADGTSAVELTGHHAAGSRLRVRSVYLQGASGDSANTTTYGEWKYFTFT